MKTIRFELSKSSIQKAIAETRQQEAKMQQLCDTFSRMLAQEGVLKARTALVESGATLTGELLGNITYDCVRPGVWKVTCEATAPSGDNYAWFVEYGTGPVGAKEKHPEADTAKYKKTGWVTRADGKDMENLYGWTPITAEDGNVVYYTAGQPSAHFMYDSREHIQKREVTDRIMAAAFKEVFG